MKSISAFLIVSVFLLIQYSEGAFFLHANQTLNEHGEVQSQHCDLYRDDVLYTITDDHLYVPSTFKRDGEDMETCLVCSPCLGQGSICSTRFLSCDRVKAGETSDYIGPPGGARPIYGFA